MSVSVKVEGFRDLEKALDDMTKGAGRGVVRRSLLKAGEPLKDKAAALAPRRSGNLAKSMNIGTGLDKRQASLRRKMFADERASVEVFVGPDYKLGGGGRHGHLVEFGTAHSAPKPFMRPAWESEKDQVLKNLSLFMWAEIEKSIARAERKAARAAAKAAAS